MTASAEPAFQAHERRAITTIDALKVLGVVTFLVDHYGFYFHTDELWWRLFGRVASPIFFFLIGFARTRTVPWTWLVFGAVLTVSQAWTIQIFNLNILLNFALLRFAVLPLVERFVFAQLWLLAAFVIACYLLIVPTDPYLEYGTQGWLWALFGLGHRLRLEARTPRFVPYLLGAVAAAVYLRNESVEYGFTVLQTSLFVAMIVAVSLILANLTREKLAWQPGEILAPLFRFCGRRSLEIYAITLFGMQVVAYAIRP